MVDIDLLVPPEDLGQAAQAVETTGYKPLRPYDPQIEQHHKPHRPIYLRSGSPQLEIH